MSHAYLLQEIGDQIQLEQQSNSFLILETDDDVGIHLTGQPHATQAYYSGVEQLHPLDFVFIIKASTIRKLKLSVGIKASFIAAVKSIPTSVKATILIESRYPFKLKSSLLTQLKETIKIKANYIKQYKLVPISRKIKEEKIMIRRVMENKKLKKALLKLIERFEDDD